MNIDEFWRFIEVARSEAGDDLDARVGALTDQLGDCSATELQSFQNHYDEQIRRSYRWDLWAAAYIMNGGCSDDGFRYFRDWLISEGRGTFDKALGNPESLADMPRIELAELESFGYVASELFEGKDEGELDRDFSTEGAEPAGQQWSEDEVYGLYPRLAAKYG